MGADSPGCGAVYALYAAARDGDLDTVESLWEANADAIARLDATHADRVADAVSAGEPTRVAEAVADAVFVEAEQPTVDGPVAGVVGTLLYGFGYLASLVLFFRAHSREAVVGRLRWAYRQVGVSIRDTETVDGMERTVFRCPYRTLGADRWGSRRACHDVLDRVDDGYVTFLARYRDIDYRRPRACAGSECCYSEVAALE